MSATSRIRFGPFELDPQTGELWKHSVRTKLAPQPLRALLLLIAARGGVVTRETLRQQLWGDHTTVDFEQGLNFCIRELRTTLRDNAKKPRYVETLPRLGYRFIGTLTGLPVAPNSNPETGQIEAYQCYLEGKKSLSRFGKQSLEDAAASFRQALELQPDYALAHAGLGAAYSLRTLNRRDPQDLNNALAHLRKALELDPILAEPYPWLCYVNIRLGQMDQAITAGQRAIELQPELVHGHYFLGCARFAASETNIENYQLAANHLWKATEVEPRWQASWFILSYLALMTGDPTRAAQFAQQLLDRSVHAPLPFIGAEIVLATLEVRKGNWARARSRLIEFLERMQATDHMYKDSMTAIAACVLGETEIRDGNAAAALAAFRRAWHTLQEHPRTVAHQRVCARAQAGLAAAFALQGDISQAVEQLVKAKALTADSLSCAQAAAGANIAELYVGLAAAHMLLHEHVQAMSMVQAAVAAGWLDAAGLAADPCLRPLHQDPQFQTLLRQIRRATPISYGVAFATFA